MSFKCLLIALLGLSLLLTGCNQRGAVNTVERSSPVGQVRITDDKRVVTSIDLDQMARVLQVNEARASNLLKMQFAIQNQTDRTVQVHYQVVWFDESGIAITSPTPVWKVLPLYAGETRYVTDIAPNPRVMDFQLKLLDRETFERTGGNIGNTGGPRGR